MTEIQSPATTVPLKHRKAASTGGGRAWSEAEEAFLIETRERKMPYKHIAAQLKKTELACRLHYHQLSFGSKSRHNHNNHHRNSSTPIATTATLPQLRTSSQRPLPSFSPPASPPEKPILPLPRSAHPSFPRAHTTSPLSHHGSSHPLRLQTSDLTPRSQSIDLPRLNNIYTTHRLHFWSVIAADYGDNLSPATLEDAWRRGWQQAGHFPPTPRGSPLSSRGESRERDVSGLVGGCFSALPATTDAGKFGGSSSVGGTWGEQRAAPRSAFVGVAGRRGSMGFARGDAAPPVLPQLKTTIAAATTTPISTRGGFSVGSLLTEDREVRSPAGSSSERSSIPPATSDVVMQEVEQEKVVVEKKSEEREEEQAELATVVESRGENA